ncbi:hypothetical protein PENTCL1PPCAC_20507, partial [Pristionchus entomophagus]
LPPKELLFSLPPLHQLGIMNIGNHAKWILEGDDFIRIVQSENNIQLDLSYDHTFRMTPETLRKAIEVTV